MISLLAFTPFQPTPGLAFWALVIFLLFWTIMYKMAFKPISEALAKREDDIQNALDQARIAKEEMSNLKSENEKLLAEAREERAKILVEAKEAKVAIIAEAKHKAKEEASKIMQNAMHEIDNHKKAAMVEVKNEIGILATQIAEKVLRKELKGQSEHNQYVNDLIKEMNLN
ncbi:MAG: F0F1 ATP synthase subunit B [Saprospiraceae bacterium]|nr:F0F1 ATP synthase subunit B [Saprospiraceae bacterium]MBK6564943.1 F0F1 ATP synthase subunit B [Saprospiraceae bacterium]MBK7523584.1 F0F1 ATP synthase subunit B [Saprospiraceae bacterium]MBK8371426.1 F0F1 ATP synthase subunit B [Saprospiraceae bacterium]MBK8818796.1 F0F1 ATP synthase subunit B [Saprospiraceae bacterium]